MTLRKVSTSLKQAFRVKLVTHLTPYSYHVRMPSRRYHTDPFQKLAESYPYVGTIRWIFGTRIGSGVFIKDRFVLTAAHVMRPNFGKYSFTLNDIDYEVVSKIEHPLCTRKFKDPNDLALLVLNRPVDFSGPLLEISYKMNMIINGVAVGYPHNFASCKFDGKKQEASWTNKKIAVKTSCALIDELLLHKVGYKCSDASTIERIDDPLDAGTFGGASGGGLFNEENKLAGIIHGGTHTDEWDEVYSHEIGDRNYFVPLSKHQEWIESSICTDKLSTTLILEACRNINKAEKSEYKKSKENNSKRNISDCIFIYGYASLWFYCTYKAFSKDKTNAKAENKKTTNSFNLK